MKRYFCKSCGSKISYPTVLYGLGMCRSCSHIGKKRPEVIERDKRRLTTYKEYGYKTLIIWEHELKNTDRIINKILKFNEV